MEKWARTGHLITRHRGATDFHRGLAGSRSEVLFQSRHGSSHAWPSAERSLTVSLHHLVSSAGPLSGLAATVATVTLSSGVSSPPCTATLPLPVQGPVTHEYHLEALPASSGLGDLSAIPERGLPLPRWDRGFARLRWPAQSFAGANPLSDSLTRPESSRRRRRGRAPRCPATASSARTSRPFRPYPRRPELDHAAGGLQLLLHHVLR